MLTVDDIHEAMIEHFKKKVLGIRESFEVDPVAFEKIGVPVPKEALRGYAEAIYAMLKETLA